MFHLSLVTSVRSESEKVTGGKLFGASTFKVTFSSVYFNHVFAYLGCWATFKSLN